MRALSEATGHTRSYLRQQLTKYGIQPEHSPPRLAPYGWNWRGNELFKNALEQKVLVEIRRLNGDGKGCKSIAAELNRRSIRAKAGGLWGSSSVQNILNRFPKKSKTTPSLDSN